MSGKRVFSPLVKNNKPKKEKMIATKYPPLAQGTLVRTTHENPKLSHEWSEEGRRTRKWGVEGIVDNHSDSHGLCYKILHKDGTEGFYDPSEIQVITP